MKTKNLLILPLFALCATSCSLNGVAHDISEYMLTIDVDVTKDFNILQLTDIHLGDTDDLDLHFKFMDLTIKDANADMIVVTGDLFTFASQATAHRLFAYFDSKGIPWTVTFGNHDEQCMFSVEWLTSTLNNWGGNCKFKDIQDDNVTGNANFAINLRNKDDHTKIHEQIVILDSNRYYFGSYFGYDYIKQDQIDWYESLVKATKALNGGTTVESLMFAHIPVPEINDAYAAYERGETGVTLLRGTKGEKCCPPDVNSGLYDKIKGLNSTKGIYYGHDHKNDFIIDYHGIHIGYGIHSTDRVYYDETKMGGLVITVKPTHNIVYNPIRHTYKEVK